MRCTGSKTGAKGSYNLVQMPRFPLVTYISKTAAGIHWKTDNNRHCCKLAIIIWLWKSWTTDSMPTIFSCFLFVEKYTVSICIAANVMWFKMVISTLINTWNFDKHYEDRRRFSSVKVHIISTVSSPGVRRFWRCRGLAVPHPPFAHASRWGEKLRYMSLFNGIGWAAPVACIVSVGNTVWFDGGPGESGRGWWHRSSPSVCFLT
jgi:hypothetical protein